MIKALRASRASRQSLLQLLQLLQGPVTPKEPRQAGNAKLPGPQSPSQKPRPGQAAHLWAGARYSKQATHSSGAAVSLRIFIMQSLVLMHFANAACTVRGVFC